MMTRREVFKVLGLGTFALTVDPLKLLAAPAKSRFKVPPIERWLPMAPYYCRTMFRDEMLAADILRAHCRWKNEEYGLEYTLADFTVRDSTASPEEVREYFWERLEFVLSNAVEKVGAPRLTKATYVRDLRNDPRCSVRRLGYEPASYGLEVEFGNSSLPELQGHVLRNSSAV